MALKPRHKRWALIGLALLLVATAAAMVLRAFNDNLVFFRSPSEVIEGKAPANKPFRLGGLVEVNSVVRDGVQVQFKITDTAHTIPVTYTGILPDLFREGKGVVAQGTLDANGMFQATEVLAKHDENYMPPEAAHALEQANKAQKSIQP